MSLFFRSSFLIALLGSQLLGAQEPTPEDIRQMVEDLASDSFREREEATSDLWLIGEEALAPLREASVSDDPEKSLRATELLDKIELRITPDTPDSILVLIKRYQDAPANEKANFLNELKRKRAYFQVLKLYSMEERPEIKSRLVSVIRGVAISGARESISTGDDETAIEFLKMSASEPTDLMALACLYRSMGRLDEELENLAPPKNVATDLWQITLLRAKGDLQGALRLAVNSKSPELVAALKILTGDPTMWIRQNGFADRAEQAHPVYVDLALKRWSRREIEDADFAPLLAILEGESEEKEHAISALATLGRLSEVEKLQAAENPDLGFQYYLSQEKIPEALKSIGIDRDQPDWTNWVEKRFAEIEADDQEGENGSAIARLVMIAGFLENRGLHDELAEAYDQALENYSKENENHFLDLLGSLFTPEAAPHYAKTAAASWAGEDENRWSEVFAVALGDNDAVSDWVTWVKETEPNMGYPKILETMMAIFKIGNDPEHLRIKWIGRAWDSVASAEEQEKARMIQRIMSLAVGQQDVGNALKAWDMLDNPNSSMWSSIDKYLSAAGRWSDAADILDESGRIAISSSPELRAYLAVTLRRAGFEKRAAEQEKWAEKLSLGYPQSCKRIGDYYTYGGDPERAAIWYERAVYQADPSSGEFVAVLGSYADSVFEQGNWEIAASSYEAYAQVHASRNFTARPLSFYSKARLSADLARALAILPESRKEAISLLEGIHENFVTDGVLADNFFPLVRESGLTQELGRWFGESWENISNVISRYPESDNSRNTAAWFASRAGMKLVEAEEHLEYALDRNPNQPAYLDTMAEIHFAGGDRKSAIEWSDRALMHYPLTEPTPPFDLMIRKQNHRFHLGDMP